ncbi:DUF389 domain-containing protein [Psychrobacter sp. I-STPA6b]|uniref:DUF389 domain-containing protein n=1 Tax=Psychrobacter sp. I-STPA6b TaxID=2585718 RepID=UPI001D0C85E7|nr:DUF389 domain-containing protein [Psychrobacter sp. I-STPA6b]
MAHSDKPSSSSQDSQTEIIEDNIEDGQDSSNLNSPSNTQSTPDIVETHQLAEDVVEISVKPAETETQATDESHSSDIETQPTEITSQTPTQTESSLDSTKNANSDSVPAITHSTNKEKNANKPSAKEEIKEINKLDIENKETLSHDASENNLEQTTPKDSESLKAEKEAQLEAYRQFIAEQENHKEIDYQKIRISIEANALPSQMYFIMNALSAVIASYGLVINSAAVVIGAMLVAMMLGPISGVALAIIDYRIPFLKKSLLTVLAGGIMVITIGFIIGLLHQGQPLTNEILSRTQPTSMDLMIALAGGTAGAYAIISPHLSVAVVGVAVATALVPPLAASGILFANGEGSLGFGALLLALTNIIAIQFTNALVLWFSGFRRLVKDDYKKGTAFTFFRRNAVTLLLLFGLGIYLSVNLNVIARTQRFENDVKSMISDYFIDQGDVLTATQFVNRNEYQTIRAVIRGETQPTARDVEILEQKITERIAKNYPNIRPVHLQIRYLPVVVIEADPEQTDKIDQTDAAILSSEK